MTGFKDIVGMDEIKKTIRDDLILMKIRDRGDSKGIILTGVSGAGKSFIADKLQEEIDLPMLL